MQLLGPYRLLSLIQTGKATQIWEAIRDATGQRVAIKALAPSATREDAALLKNEFRILGQLRHENVIQALDLGQHQGKPYLVLELFRVPNMKTLVRQGLDHYAQVLDPVVRQATLAVRYLAEQGVVHRDIKPDNFLVDQGGRVKLIDFALAQRVRPGWLRWLPARSKIQGTPSYLAPEVLRGQGATPATDIYSLGCTLFELLCGRPPFTAPSTQELLRRHLTQAPPNVRTYCPRVSKPFAQLLQQMLAKDPRRRISAAELAEQLEQICVLEP